jgi:hypothetical protein
MRDAFIGARLAESTMPEMHGVLKVLSFGAAGYKLHTRYQSGLPDFIAPADT